MRLRRQQGIPMVEQQDIAAWPGVKDPGLGAKTFTANNVEYGVATSMSIRRWEEFEILQVEVGMARSYDQFHAQHVKLASLVDKLARREDALGEMMTILNDLINGGFLVTKREVHPALKMCALFINRKDEDLTTITDAMIAEKINDWRTEGISVNYFFGFAWHLIPGFVAAYKASSPATSAPVSGNPNPSGRTDTRDSSNASAGTAHGQSSSA